MKLNKEFLLHSAGGEVILVPTANAGFSGVVRGNATLGAVLELLRGGVTESELLAAMKARFDAPKGAVEADVAKALDELRKIGALDE